MKRHRALSLALAAALVANGVQAQDAGTSTTAPPDYRKTDAEIATAQANARKAQADAKKAEQDLYSGIVTAAGGRGAVTVNTGAGVIEATSVASDSLAMIGEKLEPQIEAAYDRRTSPVTSSTPLYCSATSKLTKSAVVIVTDEWEPDTGIIELIDPALSTRTSTAEQLKVRANIQIGLIRSELANVSKPKGVVRGPPAGGFAPAALMAGASALMAAMKTDVDLSVVPLTTGDAILLRTVAGQFKSRHKDTSVFVPGIVNPRRGPGKALLARFAALETKLSILIDLQAQFSALAGKANSGAAAAGEKTPLAAAYGEIGKEISQLRAPLDAFVTAQQSWLATMVDSSKGKSLAQVAAEQAEIGCIAAHGGVVVRVKADAFGGSIFTRKNLWTTFGGTPIFVSAGAVVTYSFNDLQTGEFINSGVIKSMGPWKPIIKAGPRGSVETTNVLQLPAVQTDQQPQK